MIGAIRTWDILAHPVVTIRCFGWRVFFRAVLTGQDQTFLSLLGKTDFFAASASSVPEIIDRCIKLEVQAMQIYKSLAQRFPRPRLFIIFLAELASHEQIHAEMLALCRAAVSRGRRDERSFRPWQGCLARLEREMQEVSSLVSTVDSMDAAAQLVIQIESSEINEVFMGVVTATDSPFVRKLKPFRNAVENHIALICRMIPEFAPQAMLACQELRAKFLRG